MGLPSESSDDVIGLYGRACAHADATIAELDLDSAAHVPWWSDQNTTLGVLLIRMVAETAQHPGHADIVRELIDGRAGNTEDPLGDDPAFWGRFMATGLRRRRGVQGWIIAWSMSVRPRGSIRPVRDPPAGACSAIG